MWVKPQCPREANLRTIRLRFAFGKSLGSLHTPPQGKSGCPRKLPVAKFYHTTLRLDPHFGRVCSICKGRTSHLSVIGQNWAISARDGSSCSNYEIQNNCQTGFQANPPCQMFLNLRLKYWSGIFSIFLLATLIMEFSVLP